MSAWRMLVFVLFSLCIWGGTHFYIGRRLVRSSRLRGPWRRAAWVAVMALAVAPLLAFSSRWMGESPLCDVLHWVGFSLGGFSSTLFVFVVASDLVRLALWTVKRGRGRPSHGLLGVCLVAAAAILTSVGLVQALRPPRVIEVDVPIEALPPALEGFRIVQLTDLHLGPILGREEVEDLVERANRLHADVVAITGDLVDGSVEDLGEDVAPLASLRARHGAFFVTGNHEYYSNAEDWCREIERLGLRVLLNEHRILDHGGGRVLLAGVTDLRAGSRMPGHVSDPEAAIAGAPRSDVKALLAHQPKSAFGAERAGFDVLISGHTHGGQYFPMSALVHLFQPFVNGLYRHESIWLYVSAGSGFWGPPVRTFVPAEVTVLRLVQGG